MPMVNKDTSSLKTTSTNTTTLVQKKTPHQVWYYRHEQKTPEKQKKIKPSNDAHHLLKLDYE